MSTADIKNLVDEIAELTAILKEVAPSIKELVKQAPVKPKKEKEYLTLKELCGVMEITQKTFYVNRMAEQIPAYKFGKSIKYKKKDIEKFRI